MKAVLFNKTGPIANLEVGEVPRPGVLQRGSVRLKFLAGSLNHLDLWVLKGLPRVDYRFPHICGADVCGEVLESKSKKFKPGQKVLVYPATSSGRNLAGQKSPENLCEDFGIRGENAPGVFCEELVIEDRYLQPMPKHLKPSEAASLPLVYLTAWQMVAEKAGLSPREKFTGAVLVHAAGSGVTQAILELLRSLGVRRVAVTSRSKDKLLLWEKRGYAGFVLSEQTRDDLQAWLKLEKFSLIFDHVGSGLFDMNIRLLKNGGKFITCGATSGADGKLDLRHLYFRQLQLLGSTMGSLQHFEAVIKWIAKKKIRPQISRIFPLNEVREAYAFMENAGQTGKIVLSG